MRILFQTRSDVFTFPAGDTIQFNETKKWLGKLGVEVDVSFDQCMNLAHYDLVHIFNITTALNAKSYIENAERWDTPAVISPVYWPPIQKQVGTEMIRLDILRQAEAILPNSEIEGEVIVERFKLDKPLFIVPNGIDTEITGDPFCFLDKYGPDPFVLCVGRFEKRKNQQALMLSMIDEDIRLVFIGEATDQDYYYYCEEMFEKRPDWLHIRSLDRKEIFSAYAAAKAHACVSLFDTPGLVNLEAGYLNCNIVSSGTGSQKEYLKDFAHYCFYDNEESIREAVKMAMKSECDPQLRTHIQENYTWEIAAKKTLEAYETII